MNPTMSAPLLDPKNDFVFKTLFIRVPELLPALINAVRVGEQPVEILEPTFRPPQSSKIHLC